MQLEENRERRRNLGWGGRHLEAVRMALTRHHAGVVAHVVAHALVEAGDERVPTCRPPAVVEDNALATIGDSLPNPLGQRLARAEARSEDCTPMMGLEPTGQALEQRH